MEWDALKLRAYAPHFHPLCFCKEISLSCLGVDNFIIILPLVVVGQIKPAVIICIMRTVANSIKRTPFVLFTEV